MTMKEYKMANDQSGGRPPVIQTLSETQVQDLEQNYSEQDRHGWDELTQSYGWSDQESQAVWDWFGQQPGRSAGTGGQS
jgi:hypothetical protein